MASKRKRPRSPIVEALANHQAKDPLVRQWMAAMVDGIVAPESGTPAKKKRRQRKKR